MSELAVIESGMELEVAAALPVMSITDCAEIANREYKLAESSFSEGLDHLYVVGQALLTAQAQVPWGKWEEWLRREFHGGTTDARLCMRLAKYKVFLSDISSVSEAKKKLRMFALFLPTDGGKVPPAIRKEAVRLTQSGHTVREVADLCGVSEKSVRDWTNPAAAKERNLRNKRRARAAKAALSREERAKRSRTVGGDASTAYSQARLLAETLDRAMTSYEGNPEARKALEKAYHLLRSAEDQIDKAIRTLTSKKTL